jgi:XTP/dITP diphosphohydrolase
MLRLLVASNNPGKLKEIRTILRDLMDRVQLITPVDLDLELDIAETGQTYAENAAIKVHGFSRAAVDAGHQGLIILADDSGLEVDALGGAPGLYSARFSPLPGATDADRRAHMLFKLEGSPPPRSARFHCTVALMASDGIIHYAEGSCKGEIITEERGNNGFGYDPIFWIPRLGRTMAELPSADKNQISHRAHAIQAATPQLIQLITADENNSV